MHKLVVISFIFATSFATQSFSQSLAKKGYEITGTVIGFPDSTLIHLMDPGTGAAIDIDSAFIINNKFHFTGSINGQAIMLFLAIDKSFENYKYFWLENPKIEFSAEKGKFKNAVITGSKAQVEQEQLDAALDTTHNDTQQTILFIRNHPNSIVGARMLSFEKAWGRDTIETLFNGFSDEVKKSNYGKDCKDFISLNKKIDIGGKFVDFTEQNPAGKQVSLSDFKGKIVLLEFWASGCGACRESNPKLVKYYKEFKDRGFEVLGVALDSKKEYWVDAIKYDGLPWENISDLKGWQSKAALIYGIYYMPTNFLIDRNGIIIAKDLRDEALRNKILEVFK
jgi:peroxiredoxin